MPIHDWSRVNPGTFHDFHLGWIGELRKTLNSGLLPSPYYAMAEQIAGPLGPDVLTLEATDAAPPAHGNGHGGAIAVGTAAPRVQFTAATEMDDYVLKRRTLVIRHSSDDRIIALLEIVSPGNKSNRHAIRSFLEKATESLYRGYHLLVVDLHPPGRRDPQGILAAIWGELSDDAFTPPAGKPLTLAAYSAGQTKWAYVQPVAVGDLLPDMPLFLEPDTYINVPLELTYQEAYRGVPFRWRRVLEAGT